MTTTKLTDRHADLLGYLVDRESDGGRHAPVIEAGASGGDGVAPYPTLAAMARRGLVEIDTRTQAALHCPRVTYRVAQLTDAGRDAVRAHRAARQCPNGHVVASVEHFAVMGCRECVGR